MAAKKEERFIKIPADFKSLHDLKELVSNYDMVNRLVNALNGYQRLYLESFLMTPDEVLKYIPEKQQRDYVLINRERLHYHSKSYEYEKKRKKLTLADYLNDIFKTKDDKVFMVNTVEKQVNYCHFASKLDKHSNSSKNLKYGELTFELNNKTKVLTMKVHYSYTAQQAVGGVSIWTAGGGSYRSGGTYHPYTKNGYDMYQFCTKTNKYLGYAGNKEDPDRPWIKKTTSY